MTSCRPSYAAPGTTTRDGQDAAGPHRRARLPGHRRGRLGRPDQPRADPPLARRRGHRRPPGSAAGSRSRATPAVRCSAATPPTAPLDHLGVRRPDQLGRRARSPRTTTRPGCCSSTPPRSTRRCGSSSDPARSASAGRWRSWASTSTSLSPDAVPGEVQAWMMGARRAGLPGRVHDRGQRRLGRGEHRRRHRRRRRARPPPSAASRPTPRAGGVTSWRPSTSSATPSAAGSSSCSPTASAPPAR